MCYRRAFWSFLPCFCTVSTSEKNNMRTAWCQLVCVFHACCGQRTLVRDPGRSYRAGVSWSSGPWPGEDAHLLSQKPQGCCRVGVEVRPAGGQGQHPENSRDQNAPGWSSSRAPLAQSGEPTWGPGALGSPGLEAGSATGRPGVVPTPRGSGRRPGDVRGGNWAGEAGSCVERRILCE